MCEGVVKEIVIEHRRLVYLVHEPAFYETATMLEQEWQEQGYTVIRLNTGVEEEAERAEELLERYCH